MRTATIEAVLGPVADAIGEFLIANEEAELHDIPLGDLTPVAEGVAISVKGLLDVANSLSLSTADDDLKIEMPLACQEVENAVADLNSSTRALKTDPMNTYERAKMIDAAKGILNGTRRVLECFDDYEVRKILKACRNARQQVNEMKKVESVDALVAVIQPACQSLITLAQLTDKRVNELLEPWTKIALTQAREVIKGSSTLMVSSSKAYVTNMDKPSRDSARESRSLCIDKLLVAIDEVERIVQIKQAPPEKPLISQLAKDRVRVRDALVDIHQAVVARSPEALQQAFKIFDPAKDNILRNARNIAAGLQNQQKKAEILKTCDNIERLRKELEEAAKYAIAHPDDAAAQQRVIDLLKEIDAEFDKLDRLVNEALLEDIDASLACLTSNNPDSTLAKLLAAAHAGDIDAVNRYTAQLQKEADALHKKADQVAERSTDPDAVRQIRQAQQNLRDLLPQVISASKTVALNPNDPAAKEHLTAVVSEWENGVSKLKTAIDNAQSNEDIIAAASKGIKQDLVKFEEACRKQDAAMLKDASQAITQKIQAATAAAQREIDNSDDPEYQGKVRVKLAEMQKILPELQSQAKNAFSKPNDPAAQKALHNTGQNLVSKLDDLFDIVHQHNNPTDQGKWAEMERQLEETRRREAEKKRLEEEMRKKSEAEREAMRKKQEEEARRLAEEEQAWLREQEAIRRKAEEAQRDNPIKAAALGLKLEANKWDSEGNKMIQLSNELADDMALLSELSKLNTPEAKKQLIETARRIAQKSKLIEAEARKVAQNCSDKKLKADLLIIADRIGTIANQVKILSTVKAANPSDPDADQMLVTACTNLMGSVTKTIDASQSAQIRSFKTAATAVTAALKWRRKAAGGASSKSLASVLTNK